MLSRGEATTTQGPAGIYGIAPLPPAPPKDALERLTTTGGAPPPPPTKVTIVGKTKLTVG